MTQQHLDRLTAIDASFLAQETAVSHMHVGAITIFEGPPPDYEEIVEALRARLHLVPRYRQKLAVPPLGTGRPLWADDPDFNLEYHVRQSALPAPGSDEQLFNLVSRVFSQQRARSKPLWELWAVEGLEDGRFALISKTHHALIDGVAGVDLARVIFDLSPEPRPLPHAGQGWKPSSPPSGLALAVHGLRGLMRTPLELASRAVEAARRPVPTLEAAIGAAEGLGEVVWAGLNPAPETPLNVA